MKRSEARGIDSGTTTDRLIKLERKLAELLEERRVLTARMTAAEEQEKVEAILHGENVDDVIGKQMQAIEAIDAKTSLLRKAIREQAQARDQERVVEGREAREKLRPAWERALRQYHGGVKAAVAALSEIQALNDKLHADGYTPFPHLFFPGMRVLPGTYDRQEATFFDVLKQHGVTIK